MHLVFLTKLVGISLNSVNLEIPENVHVNLHRSLFQQDYVFCIYCLALGAFGIYRSKQTYPQNYYKPKHVQGLLSIRSDFLFFEVIICKTSQRVLLGEGGSVGFQRPGWRRGAELREAPACWEHNKIQLLADRREKAPLFCQPMRLPSTSVRL